MLMVVLRGRLFDPECLLLGGNRAMKNDSARRTNQPIRESDGLRGLEFLAIKVRVVHDRDASGAKKDTTTTSGVEKKGRT